MVVEVGSLNRNTLEPFRTWCLERSGCEDDAGIDVSTDLLPLLRPRQCPRHQGNCPSTSTRKTGLENKDAHLKQRLDLSTTNPECHLHPSKPHCPPFTLIRHRGPSTFDFSPRQAFSLKLEKRRRAESDVDGPHTATLSSKKRRLRLHLITSRLSQPFSLPATHIINRDAVASGDKRFVKLAAVATSPDTGKQGLNREGSVMLRAAVLNRVRLRVRSEATQRGDIGIAVAAANAAVLHHGQQLATGARFVAPSTALADHQQQQQQQQQPPPRVVLMRPGASSTLSQNALSPRAETKPSPPKTPPSARIQPKSPRLQPSRSPVLTPSETLLDEMGDEGGLAFPTSDRDCQYAWADEDDLEDVYSDFGAIFGSSAQKTEDGADGSYEEYLDELDGISWVDR